MYHAAPGSSEFFALELGNRVIRDFHDIAAKLASAESLRRTELSQSELDTGGNWLTW